MQSMETDAAQRREDYTTPTAEQDTLYCPWADLTRELRLLSVQIDRGSSCHLRCYMPYISSMMSQKASMRLIERIWVQQGQRQSCRDRAVNGQQNNSSMSAGFYRIALVSVSREGTLCSGYLAQCQT